MNNAERTQLVTDVTAAVLAALEARDAAKPQPRKARASRKAPQPKAVRCLVKGNRREFVEAHAWAEGLSCLDIAIALVHFHAPLAAGWALGEGYTTKARTATAAAKRTVKAHLA